MAIVHVVMKSSSSAPPSAAHADYISRDGQYRRRGGAELVESGNMPEFASGEARLFWEAADQHERKNGRAYTELQIALPRELSQVERHELARTAAREFMGERFAYTLAVHNPVAKDAIEQPHFHLMFSERAIDENTRALPGDRLFKRSGAKKDPAWNDRNKPMEVRTRWCELVNDALAKAGHEARVDPRSWAEQGREDLAALVEPKLPPGSEKSLPKLHAEVEELREQRRELPCLYLPATEATARLEKEAEDAVEEVRKKEARELSLLNRWIAELSAVMKKVFKPGQKSGIQEGKEPQVAEQGTIASSTLPEHLRKLAWEPDGAAYLVPTQSKEPPTMLAYFRMEAGRRQNPNAVDVIARHDWLLDRNNQLVRKVEAAEEERDLYAREHRVQAMLGSSAYKRLEKQVEDSRAQFHAQRPELEESKRAMEPLRQAYHQAMSNQEQQEAREVALRAEVDRYRVAYEAEVRRAELQQAASRRASKTQKRQSEPLEDALAIQLTQRQAELLIERQFRNDPAAQARAWADIQAGEPVAIAGRAWLEYSREDRTYFAQLAPVDFQPFTDLLAQQSQRDQKTNSKQGSGWGKGRERE